MADDRPFLQHVWLPCYVFNGLSSLHAITLVSASQFSCSLWITCPVYTYKTLKAQCVLYVHPTLTFKIAAFYSPYVCGVCVVCVWCVLCVHCWFYVYVIGFEIKSLISWEICEEIEDCGCNVEFSDGDTQLSAVLNYSIMFRPLVWTSSWRKYEGYKNYTMIKLLKWQNQPQDTKPHR